MLSKTNSFLATFEFRIQQISLATYFILNYFEISFYTSTLPLTREWLQSSPIILTFHLDLFIYLLNF